LRSFKAQQQAWKNEEEGLQSIVQLHQGDLDHEKCVNARSQSDFDQFKQQATALEKELRADLASSRNVVETVKRDAAQLALEHVRANRMLHAEIAKIGVSVEAERAFNSELSCELEAERLLSMESKARLHADIMSERQRMPPRDAELERLRALLVSDARDSASKVASLTADVLQAQRSLETTIEWGDGVQANLDQKTLECDALIDELSMQKQAYSVLEGENADLESQLRRALAEIVPVKEALAKTKELLLAVEQERDALAAQVPDLQAALAVSETALQAELRKTDSLHTKLDNLTVQCNKLQADNHSKSSKNERLAHKNTLQASKLKNATDENDRAQNKLLQSLREISLLRKDRDLGEGEIEELMRDRAQVEGTLFTTLKSYEDANVKLFKKDVQLGEVHDQLTTTEQDWTLSDQNHNSQVKSLEGNLNSASRKLNREKNARAETTKELQECRSEFEQAEKDQFNVAGQLDRARTEQVGCEAIVSALTEGASQLQVDQQLIGNDLDRMTHTGTSTNYLSSRKTAPKRLADRKK